MFNKKNYVLMLVAASLSFIACDKNETTVTPDAVNFENGILIGNEGLFNTGTGTVSHYDPTTKTLKTDIFAEANSGAKIGNILQSLATYQGNTYLMVNNASRVYVVDSKTFKFKDSIKGVPQPRYFEVIDAKKAYISDWANGVSVLDLATNKIIKSIKVGKGAERMLRDGSNLWVVNSGAFDKDSTISIIDVTTDALVKTLKTGLCPNSIAKANGNIWVLCGSHWEVPNVKGRLLEYKNNVIVNSYDVPNGASRLVASKDGNTLYFIAENAVCIKDATKANVAPSVHIQTVGKAKFGSLYGLGIDKNDVLYCADAKKNSSNGTVYSFNPTTKVLQDSIKAGIFPSFLLFGN
jgi:DNA-binding beta-propeller fold protein YncE